MVAAVWTLRPGQGIGGASAAAAAGRCSLIAVLGNRGKEATIGGGIRITASRGGAALHRCRQRQGHGQVIISSIYNQFQARPQVPRLQGRE
ncbi:hypothetical protein ACP4OV_008765 [Aristida adscensionis]